MHSPFSESMDLAQVVLYAFWFFFAGLIFWLRREDRREGYPVELDSGVTTTVQPMFIPPAKTFLLPHNEGTVEAPNFKRPSAEYQLRATSPASGSPMEPVGEPLLSAVGPASWALRSDHPELTREGHDAIVPMRVAQGYSVSAGPDPRGWTVVGGDGKPAGVVKDLWVDRADVMVRYLEIALEGDDSLSGRRLVPVPMLRLLADPRKVEVYSLLSGQFKHVPGLKSPDRVTLLEEEKIGAFYAGGRLYAEPRRMGPAI